MTTTRTKEDALAMAKNKLDDICDEWMEKYGTVPLFHIEDDMPNSRYTVVFNDPRNENFEIEYVDE